MAYRRGRRPSSGLARLGGHEMAREVDLDLSMLPVDYVDRIHFGRAGQASLARAIAEVM